MNSRHLIGVTAFVAAVAVSGAVSAQMNHEQHMAMQKRGEKAMGFDQARTTHHFRLSPKGGAIEVHVNDPKDVERREQVVAHLKRIAEQFGRGDFQTPFAVHGETPDGVPALERFGSGISYTFEPDEAGGRVVIATESKKALSAVHDFLRYQIREHHTGDPVTVEGR
jgi:hypothetical protein